MSGTYGTLCTFYPDCRYGDACRFIHPSRVASRGPVAPHKAPLALRQPLAAFSPLPCRQLQLRAEIGDTKVALTLSGQRSLMLSVQIDVSGSMSGSKLRAAKQGLREILAGLRPTDLFACYTFSDRIIKLHHALPLRDIDVEKDMVHISDNFGGSTKLYDAIESGVTNLRNAFRRLPPGESESWLGEQLVITDGADTDSTTTLREIEERVATPQTPNYNLTILGVDLDNQTRRVLQKICQPKHAHLILVDDARGLALALQKIGNSIRAKLEVSNKQASVTTTWHGDPNNMPTLITGRPTAALPFTRRRSN